MTDTRENIFDWSKSEIIVAAKGKLLMDLGLKFSSVELFLMVDDFYGGYANLHFDGFNVVSISHNEILKFYE